jgi:hypothetical protein
MAGRRAANVKKRKEGGKGRNNTLLTKKWGRWGGEEEKSGRQEAGRNSVE